MKNTCPEQGVCNGEDCKPFEQWTNRVAVKSGLIAEGTYDLETVTSDIQDLCRSMSGCFIRMETSDGRTDNGILRHTERIVAHKGEA